MGGVGGAEAGAAGRVGVYIEEKEAGSGRKTGSGSGRERGGW